MSAVAIYTASIHVPTLRRWRKKTPSILGHALIEDAALELLYGKAGPIRELPFVRTVDCRRRHRRKT